MEKELTLDQRQSIDLLLWLGILLSGGICYAFYSFAYPIILPAIPFLVCFYLMYKNNKIAMREIKKNRKEKDGANKS